MFFILRKNFFCINCSVWSCFAKMLHHHRSVMRLQVPVTKLQPIDTSGFKIC